METKEFSNLIKNNNNNFNKLMIWNIINLATYPLDFVCSRKRKNKVNKLINQLALEDMPEASMYIGNEYYYILDSYYNILIDNYNDFKNQMRVLVGATPRTIARYLTNASKALLNIIYLNNNKRNINININKNILEIVDIIDIQCIEIKDKYNM